jgi:alpha-1,6-mannosyltransferase
MKGLPPTRTVWAWAALGLAGSVLIAVAGPRAVAAPPTQWWYTVGVPGGRAVANGLVYAGVGVLCIAWLGLGRGLAELDRRRLLVIGGAWLIPLAVGPPLFSHDAYSYLAQGTILHLGQNPYHTPVVALRGLGHAHMLAAVSPFWRHVTAPYGPLFLGLMSLIVAVTGSHLVAGVLAVRGLELIGVALIAWFVPRLAHALGADPVRALWLGWLSPLVMLELVAASHNDVLMVALLLAGITVALQGRPLLGVALCALAATIKVPALAGAAFIAVAWLREERTAAGRARFLLGASVAVVAVLAAVSAATGLGLSWLSSSLFAAPARVRLAITPSTEVGFTVAAVLHGVGLGANARAVEAGFGVVSTVFIGLFGLWLLYRVRVPKLALYLGGLLLVAAAAGPAAWPWYFSWGLVLLACCAVPQRSLALVAGVVVSVFLIKPNGILALPLSSAPAVMIVYVALGALFWRTRRGGRGGDPGDSEPSVSQRRTPNTRQTVGLTSFALR